MVVAGVGGGEAKHGLCCWREPVPRELCGHPCHVPSPAISFPLENWPRYVEAPGM